MNIIKWLLLCFHPLTEDLVSELIISLDSHLYEDGTGPALVSPATQKGARWTKAH